MISTLAVCGMSELENEIQKVMYWNLHAHVGQNRSEKRYRPEEQMY
jgi:hypothetical protein